MSQRAHLHAAARGSFVFRSHKCKHAETSGVATGWTGVDMSTPLLLEVAPEIDTNPTSFYRGRAAGVGPVKVRT